MKKKNSSHIQEEREDIDPVDDVVFEEDLGGEDTVKKLRERLNQCIKEKQEYLDGWQRSRAEFANAEKIRTSERVKLTEFASEDIMTDIIPTLESFSMAFANKDAWEKVDENWRKGIEYIHTQLMETLTSHGLEEISPEKDRFNPQYHDSVESIPTDDEGLDQSIESVISKGYILKGKVLKPARVRVYTYREEA